ncbi:MAG: hypothetical protein ACOZE5_17185 [Verrucomicrobiota bacterium]
MVPTPVKICFRYKNGSRGAVKAYTTVRVAGRRTPLQLHLGYVPAGPVVTEANLARLEKKLQKEWSALFNSDFVVIERADAHSKWSTLGQRRTAPVDRASASMQLKQWLQNPGAPTLACFGGLTCAADELDDQFEVFYHRSHEYIVRGRADLDAAHVATWWTERELPRLLHRYSHYVGRKPNYHFSRGGFMRYAVFNIEHGYALKEYLRTRGPILEVPLKGLVTDPWAGDGQLIAWPTDR